MKKILVIGDSTVQWIRPYRNHIDEFTYVELLKKVGYDVDIVAKPGMISKDVLQLYWNELSGKFYDIIIVSIGINDLTPRSYPRWMWKIKNNILIETSLIEKIYLILYRILTNHYIQKFCSKYRISKPWINEKKFILYLKKFQEIVLKESDASIIYLSLPKVSKRISSLLHGINENIFIYKKLIRSLTDGVRVFEIDIEKLFEKDREKYNVEGIHYTAEGHRKVFESIKKILNKKLIK